jgi:hypothetical protein
LIIYCFTSCSRIFHLHVDVTIADEGLQNLSLCSALRAFEQGGSLSCHTCCDTEPRFFQSHPKDRPIQSPLTKHEGIWRIYSNPDPQRQIEERRQTKKQIKLDSKSPRLKERITARFRKPSENNNRRRQAPVHRNAWLKEQQNCKLMSIKKSKGDHG